MADRVKPSRQYIGDRIQDRRNNFDFLRFFAAAMVIYCHSFAIGTGKFDKEPMHMFSGGQFHFGTLAVEIFFMMSGFLVMMSFDRTRNAGTFFYNRALRILPGLVLVVLATAFLLGPFVSTLHLREYLSNPRTYAYLTTVTLRGPDFLPGTFAGNVLPSSVNGSLWTLYYEVLCYILIGFLGVIGLLKRPVVLGILVLAMVARPIVGIVRPESHLFNGVSMTLLQVFLAGMLCYLYREKIPLDGRIAAAAFVVLAISIRFGFGKLALPFLGTYVVLYLAFCDWLKLSTFAKHGDFSYGLYVYAFPAQQTITQCFGGKMNQMINFLIAFPVALACAYLSWHIVEKRFLKLKRRGSSRKTVSASVGA